MNYHNITYPDMNNGAGLRVVLWLSGCSHHCAKCQNPQTWNPNSGILFDNKAHDELFEALSHDYISGITFSGGDPLNEANLYEVYNLINDIKTFFPNKTIWMYTGYTFDEIFEGTNSLRKQIVQKCDILVDGKYIDSLKDVNYPWAGSINQRIIDISQTIKEGVIRLI